MDSLKCSECGKIYKNPNNYLKHIEKEIKKCECKQNGGIISLLPKKKITVYTKSKPKTDKEMGKVFLRAKKVLDETMKKIEQNSIAYGLRNNMNKKDFNKLPIEMKEKINKLVMENEYLRGLLSSQEKQIRLMKRQVDACITKSTIQYVVK